MGKNTLPDKIDVLIAGAGPAGSTLAYELARRGIEVLLLEKARFPRGKTCAGGINVRTLRILPFGIEPVTEKVISTLSFTRRLEKNFTRSYPQPLLVTVRRENFDSFLVRQAEKEGGRFLPETRLLSLRQNGEMVEAETSSGNCRARFLVGADGARSTVAQALDLMAGAGGILTIHSEIPLPLLPRLEPEAVHIDWGTLKRSYAYLFPKKNSFALGAGGWKIPGLRLKEYQRAFLSTFRHEPGPLPFGRAGFILPQRRKRQPIQKGRCLLLGDAAGLIDPFTGEGIFFAVRSAQLAAPFIQEALHRGGNSLAAYEEAVDREIMPELESSRMFREIFNLYPSFFYQKIAFHDRWWIAMAKILRGEKTFFDLKNKLGLLGRVLMRMSR